MRAFYHTNRGDWNPVFAGKDFANTNVRAVLLRRLAHGNIPALFFFNDALCARAGIHANGQSYLISRHIYLTPALLNNLAELNNGKKSVAKL